MIKKHGFFVCIQKVIRSNPIKMTVLEKLRNYSTSIELIFMDFKVIKFYFRISIYISFLMANLTTAEFSCLQYKLGNILN